MPIAKDAVNDGTQVELGAKSVNYQSKINARGSEGSLVNLESMGVIRRLHSGVNDGVQLDCYLVDLNQLKRLGDKHIVCLQSSEPDMVTTEGDKQGLQKRQQGSAGYADKLVP